MACVNIHRGSTRIDPTHEGKAEEERLSPFEPQAYQIILINNETSFSLSHLVNYACLPQKR